jgi:hypothetical protein
MGLLTYWRARISTEPIASLRAASKSA